MRGGFCASATDAQSHPADSKAVVRTVVGAIFFERMGERKEVDILRRACVVGVAKKTVVPPEMFGCVDFSRWWATLAATSCQVFAASPSL